MSLKRETGRNEAAQANQCPLCLLPEGMRAPAGHVGGQTHGLWGINGA